MAMTRCLNCGRRTEGSRCPTCTQRHDDWQARRKIPERLEVGRDPRPRPRTRPRLCPLRLQPAATGAPSHPARQRRNGRLAGTSSCSAPAATRMQGPFEPLVAAR